jgi:hypothetical protein
MADRLPPASLTISRPRTCEYELRLPTEVYRPGEDLPLHADFVNRSDRPVTIWQSDFCFNHWVEVRAEGGQDPHPSTAGDECRKLYDFPARQGNMCVKLQPGGRYRDRTPKLNTLYELKPGHYRVRLVYKDRGDEDDDRLLVSNWAHFRIAAP